MLRFQFFKCQIKCQIVAAAADSLSTFQWLNMRDTALVCAHHVAQHLRGENTSNGNLAL